MDQALKGTIESHLRETDFDSNDFGSGFERLNSDGLALSESVLGATCHCYS